MKIGIVNDSPLAVASLRKIIEQTPGLEVMWTASDGEEAVAKCLAQRPDLLLMDLIMPRLDGVGATRRIMRDTPCPILIVTASVSGNVALVFEAMGAGAIDVVTTPAFSDPDMANQLVNKIRAVSSLSEPAVSFELPKISDPRNDDPPCVVIGSSAGGPAALAEIFSRLPRDFAGAIVVAQHVDERFSKELAEWLAGTSKLPVKLAEAGDSLTAGQIYISDGGRHLVFSTPRMLDYRSTPLLNYQPSVDVLFDSARKHATHELLGILLTGMGRDGSQGLKRLRDAGHRTIAQDEASSAIYGMPRAAAMIGAAAEILPLAKISSRIVAWTQAQRSAP